jgi:hypothetical protein
MTKKYHDLNYLKLKGNFFILIFFAFSCGNPIEKEINPINEPINKESNHFQKLKKFIRTHNKNENYSCSAVLILFENGCMNCNSNYAKLISQFVNKPNTFIIVCASGIHVDISPFIQDSLSNVYHDIKNDFEKLGIVSGSSAIFLNDDKLDTIIHISAEKINLKLDFIEAKLK